MENLDARLYEVKKEIDDFLLSLDPLVFDFVRNRFDVSGKAVRSRFTLLFSQAIRLDARKARELAVCAEMVHTASLLHDDCIDNSSLRRGRKTLNARFGINTAILMGDLLAASAVAKAAVLSSEISSELAITVKKMAEGLLMEENLKFTVPKTEDYHAVVSRKTSALFRWVALSVCYLSKRALFGESSRIAEAFGLSFQITDDALDFDETSDAGKGRLMDITEGKITMPILIALEDGENSHKTSEKLRNFLKDGARDISAAMEIAELLRESGCLEETREKAKKVVEAVRKDILTLPDTQAATDLYNYMHSLTMRKN